MNVLIELLISEECGKCVCNHFNFFQETGSGQILVAQLRRFRQRSDSGRSRFRQTRPEEQKQNRLPRRNQSRMDQ